MSAFDFSYFVAYSGGGGPKTIAQFEAPTNQRVLINSIELMPRGSTGATVPLDFELVIQNDGASSADDSPALQKTPPLASETIQTKVRNLFTVEPTTNTKKDAFTLHQQGARKVTFDKPLMIEGNTRLGLRYLSSLAVAIDVLFRLEE